MLCASASRTLRFWSFYVVDVLFNSLQDLIRGQLDKVSGDLRVYVLGYALNDKRSDFVDLSIASDFWQGR